MTGSSKTGDSPLSESESIGSFPGDLSRGRFSFRHCLSIFLLTLISGIIYYQTSADGITWEHDAQDSGELAACCATLGIPHPTGYPLYTLLGWVLIKIFSSAEPARVMVLFSVVSGALSAGFLSVVVFKITRIVADDKIPEYIARWTGAIAAGFAVFSPVFWSQALVTEVYALSMLLQTLLWLIMVDLAEKIFRNEIIKSGNYIFVSSLIFGLILAHHISSAAVIVPWIIISSLLFIRGNNTSEKSKSSIRQLWKVIPGILPGLMFYIYLPIRSAMHPALDWGNPETPINFWRHVTAWQYRGAVFGVESSVLIKRILSYSFIDNWTLAGSILATIGLIIILRNSNKLIRLILIPSLGFQFFWFYGFAFGYNVSDFRLFALPGYIVPSVLIGIGLHKICTFAEKINPPFVLIPLILAAYCVSLNIHTLWTDTDISFPKFNEAESFAVKAMANLPENSVVLLNPDGSSAAMKYAVNCGIKDHISGKFYPPRKDVEVVSAHFLKFDWYWDNLMELGDNTKRPYADIHSMANVELVKDYIDKNIGTRPILVGLDLRTKLGASYPEMKFDRRGSLFLILENESN